MLVMAALIALVWANSPWSQSYVDLWHTELSIRFGDGGLTMDLHHWINDGLMVVFFFVIGLEVRKEFAIGELVDRSRVVVPLVAGVMGMLVPAAIFLALNPSGEAAAGWGAVIGTDTAFLLGVMALVGPAVSTQLRIFLLTLTVIDDIVAVSVIGVVYSDELSLGALAVAALCLLVLVGLDRRGRLAGGALRAGRAGAVVRHPGVRRARLDRRHAERPAGPRPSTRAGPTSRTRRAASARSGSRRCRACSGLRAGR